MTNSLFLHLLVIIPLSPFLVTRLWIGEGRLCQVLSLKMFYVNIIKRKTETIMSKNKLIRLLAAQKSETGLDGEEYY